MSTPCWNQTIVNGTQAKTSYDLQGFLFWDPAHLNDQWHSYNGWELHPVTGIRLHQTLNSTIILGGGGDGRRAFEE
jgi:hypothetical protein